MQDKIESLSPRERQVLRLMGTGMRVRDVAAKLGLATSTANTHAQRGTKKLGARDSLHASILLLRHELQEEFKRSTWGKK